MKNPVALIFSFVLLSTAAANAIGEGERRVGPTATLAFQENHSELDDAARAKLEGLVRQARSEGRIKSVELAVWADRFAPKDGGALSAQDRKLAQERLRVIQGYLKDNLKVSNVDAHNMAERAHWFSRAFATKDAELKQEIARGDDPMSREEFQIIKEQGRPSRAVVLFILRP